MVWYRRYTEHSTVGLAQQWDQLNQLGMRIRHNLEQQIQVPYLFNKYRYTFLFMQGCGSASIQHFLLNADPDPYSDPDPVCLPKKLK
jgi:hypothetical protein